jgi:chaperone required for assembly of F1-ATPase
VCLDGKPLKKQSGEALVVSHQTLADKLAEEWAAQTDAIIPENMPFMQLLATAYDRVAAERHAILPPLLAYLPTDLIRYRAPKVGAEIGMAEAQDEAWNPWLIWFEKHYGVKLETTTALTALRKDDALEARLKDELEALDDLHFTLLQTVTNESGSLILALAFLRGDLSAKLLFEAAYVEELVMGTKYNEDFYGIDPLQEKVRNAKKRFFEAAETLRDILREG